MKQFIELGLVIIIRQLKQTHVVTSVAWCPAACCRLLPLMHSDATAAGGELKSWLSIACGKRTDVSAGAAPLFHTHCVCRSVWLCLVKPMRHFYEVQLCWTNSGERVFQVSDDIRRNRISWRSQPLWCVLGDEERQSPLTDKWCHLTFRFLKGGDTRDKRSSELQ